MSSDAPEADVSRFRVKELIRDEASIYGHIDNVAVVIGHDAPGAVEARNYSAAIDEVIALHPGGIGVITIVAEGATPTAAARDVIVESFRRQSKSVHAMLFVLQATGFVAAIHRSIMSSLMLVAAESDRVKIVRELEPGIAWLSKRLSPRASPEELAASIARFREESL